MDSDPWQSRTDYVEFTAPSEEVVLYTLDLEAARERVISAGGKIAKEIVSFPGGRRFGFMDPAGNPLGVWSDQ